MRVHKKPGVTGGEWASEVVAELQPSLKEMVESSNQPLTELRALIVVIGGKSATLVFHKDDAERFRERLAKWLLVSETISEGFRKTATEQFDELVAAPQTGMLPTLVIGFDEEAVRLGRFQVQIGEGFPS